MGWPWKECSYGWVVVIGRFISGFLEVGTVKSFGVLLPDIVTQLETTSSKIGLAFGLCHGLTFGLGPLTSALYRFTQSRVVMVIGSVISAVSIALASFSSEADQLVAALVFTGLGYSLMCLPTIMALNKHFVDRFALAYGIAQTGPAVGMIVMPVLTERLAGNYGWKGALFILGAINFHMMVTAIVTREPTHVRGGRKDGGGDYVMDGDVTCGPKSNGSTEHRHSNARKSLHGGHDINDVSLDSRGVGKYGACLSPQRQRPRRAKKTSFLKKMFNLYNEEEEEVAILSEDEQSFQEDYQLVELFEDPRIPACNRSDIDWPEDVRSDSCYQECKTNGHSAVCRKNKPFCPGNKGAGGARSVTDCIRRTLKSCKAFLKSVIYFLDLPLMTEAPALIFLQLSFILLTTVHVGWMVFLVPHAVAKGIPLSQAVFLSTIGGVGNLIGRIAQGPIIDRKLLTGVELSIILTVFNVVTFIIDPMLQKLSVLCVNAFFSGICNGALIPLVAICVRETVPPDRFANAVGLVSLSYGFGEPLGGYIAGRLSDMTHSYERVFVVFGGFEFMKALLLIVVTVMNRKKNKESDS